MLAVPVDDAAKVTEQLEDAPVPARVQGLPVKEPVTPVCANVTVPVGVVGVPTLVSVTVAVHVVDWPTTTGLGEQVTVVVVMG